MRESDQARMSRPMSRILYPGVPDWVNPGGDHPSGPPIAGGLEQLPSDWAGRLITSDDLRFRRSGGSCLAPGGVYLATRVAAHAGALLPHPFTLTRLKKAGGLLSVALSRESLRVAVSNHRALRSPDFPRPPPVRIHAGSVCRDHPADSFAHLTIRHGDAQHRLRSVRHQNHHRTRRQRYSPDRGKCGGRPPPPPRALGAAPT